MSRYISGAVCAMCSMADQENMYTYTSTVKMEPMHTMSCHSTIQNISVSRY